MFYTIIKYLKSILFAENVMGDAELQDAYNSDSKLKKIEMQISALRYKAVERRREIAKKKGIAADSIDELVCKKHPGAGWEIKEQIPGSKFSSLYALNKGLAEGKKISGEPKDMNIYLCKGCKSDNDTNVRMSPQMAYDCPVCGAVIGEYDKNNFDNISLLSGSAGTSYSCRICGTKLGEIVLKQS